MRKIWNNWKIRENETEKEKAPSGVNLLGASFFGFGEVKFGKF